MELEKQRERELRNRNKIQQKKPEAWKKIQQFPERVINKRSIALVQLQLDYHCNMKCSHCAISKLRKNVNGRKHRLTPKSVVDVANQIHEEGLVAICMSGGEPLMFPNLEEFIDGIKPERFVLSMDTNGLLLTEDKIKWLVNKGVDRLNMSLDGLEEHHNSFRHTKVNSWKHNIEMLPLCKKHGLDVVLNVVVTKDLVQSKEIEKHLAFVESFGFHASMIYAKPIGEFEESRDQVLNTEEIEYLESLTKIYNCSTHLTINHGVYLGCLCFKRLFSITAFGDVMPCSWIPISMGNVFEEPLSDILHRSLQNTWFSFDHQYTCHCGNRDSIFYQKILSQVDKSTEYPVDWRKIQWGV